MYDEAALAAAVEQLGRSRLLRAASEADRALLVREMRREAYPSGAVIFEKGAPGDALYFVLAGQVRIFTLDPLGHELTLRYYTAGEVFGEFSVLDGKPRSASAQAVEGVDALVLGRDEFLRFLDAHPLVGLAMMRGMVERVRYSTDYLQHVMAALDLLAVGEYEQALQAVSSATDPEIRRLIDGFMSMVREVQTRDRTLLRRPDNWPSE